MLHWLPTLWLGFVILRYSLTSFKTVDAPNVPGLDVQWAVTWVAIVLAIMLSAALLKHSVVHRIWSGLLGAAALTILLLSHTVLPALAAFGILAVSAGLGEFALQRFRLDSAPLIERVVLTTPIGIGCLALGQLLLAWLGLFSVTTSWALMSLLAIPAVFGLRSLLKLKVETGLPGHSVGIIPCGYLFLLNLVWATAPELQYDALNVHLAVPRFYLENGGLMDLPYFWNSYMAHLLSMVFGLCLALGGMLTPKFLILGLGALAAGSVYVVGRKLFNHEVGVWATLLFYSTPLVIWSSSTTYLDLPQALFVTGSVIAFLRWHATFNWIWMAVSGWIAGVAVGNKVAAIATLIAFPLIVVAYARRRPRATLQAISAYILLLLVVAAPWYWVVYEYTGNPFFPLLNATFRSPQWPAENTSLDWNTFGVGTSFSSLVVLPFRLTLDTSRFGTSRGAVGFALLLAFPLAVGLLWKGTLPQRALLAAIAVHMTVWAFTAQYGRYFISVLPLVAVVGCDVFLVGRSESALRANRMLLLVGVLAQVPVASVLFWNIPERFPVNRALGRETPESLLARGIPEYRSVRFLNGVAQPGEKILGVGMEQVRFYLDAPLFTQRYINLAHFTTPADARSELTREGFTYIVASTKALQKPPAWFGYLQPEFLESFAERLYSDDAATVFRVRNR